MHQGTQSGRFQSDRPGLIGPMAGLEVAAESIDHEYGPHDGKEGEVNRPFGQTTDSLTPKAHESNAGLSRRDGLANFVQGRQWARRLRNEKRAFMRLEPLVAPEAELVGLRIWEFAHGHAGKSHAG